MIVISCLMTSFMYFLYLFILFFFFFLGGGGGGGWVKVLVASVPDRCILLAFKIFFSLRLFETAHTTHIFKRFELLAGNRFLVLSNMTKNTKLFQIFQT